MWGLARKRPETSFRFCYRPHRYFGSFHERLPVNCKRRLLWKKSPIRCDLFHALNQRVDSGRYQRTVATFHDLFVITGEYSSPDFRKRFTQQARVAAERADLIIAVSAFTANQVHTLLGVERSRLRVVPHGVRRPSITTVSRENIILFVGAIQRRKNVARLVDAFEQTPAGWRLILAGAAGFGAAEIVDKIERSPRRRDIEMPGYVHDSELEQLYARASIFAFPSLDEGFGMPVLEAMARGVPVLTSNTSSLPEVCGDSAMFIDPLQVESIAAGLNDLIWDEDQRHALAHKGEKRSLQFSWERTVQNTWETYEELLR